MWFYGWAEEYEAIGSAEIHGWRTRKWNCLCLLLIMMNRNNKPSLPVTTSPVALLLITLIWYVNYKNLVSLQHFPSFMMMFVHMYILYSGHNCHLPHSPITFLWSITCLQECPAYQHALQVRTPSAKRWTATDWLQSRNCWLLNERKKERGRK